jgi:hypothetical protein
MVRASIRFAFAATTYHVAAAILIGAKEGTAAMNFFCDARFSRIEAVAWPLWIASYAAVIGERFVIVGAVPVRRPFPNVSGEIVESISVWRE